MVWSYASLRRENKDICKIKDDRVEWRKMSGKAVVGYFKEIEEDDMIARAVEKDEEVVFSQGYFLG